LLQVWDCSKSHANQVLLKIVKETESTYRDIRNKGRLEDNLPGITPKVVTNSVDSVGRFNFFIGHEGL
jgi:hypothetical protein